MTLHCRSVRGILSHGPRGSLLTRSATSATAFRWTTPGMTTKTVSATFKCASPFATTTVATARSMATMSGGSILTQLATENPYKDVVRYEFKNRKWNLQHVDFYSEALAIGLLENGLQPGDVVLSWLPSHFSESVSSSGACRFCLCGWAGVEHSNRPSSVSITGTDDPPICIRFCCESMLCP